MLHKIEIKLGPLKPQLQLQNTVKKKKLVYNE